MLTHTPARANLRRAPVPLRLPDNANKIPQQVIGAVVDGQSTTSLGPTWPLFFANASR